MGIAGTFVLSASQYIIARGTIHSRIIKAVWHSFMCRIAPKQLKSMEQSTAAIPSPTLVMVRHAGTFKFVSLAHSQSVKMKVSLRSDLKKMLQVIWHARHFFDPSIHEVLSPDCAIRGTLTCKRGEEFKVSRVQGLNKAERSGATNHSLMSEQVLFWECKGLQRTATRLFDLISVRQVMRVCHWLGTVTKAIQGCIVARTALTNPPTPFHNGHLQICIPKIEQIYGNCRPWEPSTNYHHSHSLFQTSACRPSPFMSCRRPPESFWWAPYEAESLKHWCW